MRATPPNATRCPIYFCYLNKLRNLTAKIIAPKIINGLFVYYYYVHLLSEKRFVDFHQR